MDSFDSIMSVISNEVVTEGLNMDTARLIKDPRVKKMRTYMKLGKKAFKLKLYDEASSYFKDSLKLCDEMKKVIDDAKEPTKLMEKFCSYFTPVISTLPPFEVQGDTYVYYEDEMSQMTNSAIKKNLQQRMNLFRVTLLKSIKMCESYKKDNPGKPSEKNIAKFKAYKEKMKG